MKTHRSNSGVCQVTGKHLPMQQLVSGTDIRKGILDLMKADHPHLDENGFVSIAVLNQYRNKYLENMLTSELGELSELEKEVIKSINEHELLSSNIETELSENLTFGERVSDKIAEFGGSWTFILIFFSFLFLWMAINVYFVASRPFDPFPFILLNLILSCLAAIQAPIIMMSQNRKEAKDRQRSEYDYQVNLKAELEIRLLHEKIDHLIINQNQRLIEIQQIQVDLLEDIMVGLKSKKH
ncbi:DUF1003 domain-containing protein [Pontibacter sp. BT310]|jgi:uncharacterized membrane protein|uniref:DUF1003 domain-containing protein n=1 Tax=Pontibacter populi TaxID=890055 RepID=A0ABS6XFV3_9BACT|nr:MULTISPECIES: DUF1003 domain-containing protein [Pontibacter]MBJ6120010.1 DUF1003 domain-containing protein [Pontibacter sp. BT310]MBR0572439.1 DUF1003 domain-containing protein [Microvirga sp. STS03]MBW3366863.1 DUF1003 domain-containing protein [Pontibacter populi]